jgi:hypothetical protein
VSTTRFAAIGAIVTIPAMIASIALLDLLSAW